MNLLGAQRLARIVTESEIGSPEYVSGLDQLVASLKNSADEVWAIFDALFRHAAREMCALLPVTEDLHAPLWVIKWDKMIDNPIPTKAIETLVAYLCGNPLHAIDALREYVAAARLYPTHHTGYLISIPHELREGNIRIYQQEISP